MARVIRIRSDSLGFTLVRSALRNIAFESPVRKGNRPGIGALARFLLMFRGTGSVQSFN